MSDQGSDKIRIDFTRSTAPRRLVAIMIADIVGYTSLTQRDERGTHTRVERIRQELILPTILEYNGILRKQRGDGFLCTFDSPVECVRCAIIIQQSMVGGNLERPEAEWIRFRIGINLGDVIIAPDDIYGDGVNVAARLEALAPPGGIYISGGVYEQIRYKLVCGYESLGDRRLKNIQDPIPIYRILPDPSAVASMAKNARWWRYGTVAAACIVVIAGAGSWLYWGQRPQVPTVIFSRETSPTPTPIPTTPIVPSSQTLPSQPATQTTPVTPPQEPSPVPTPVPAVVAPPPPPPQQQAMVVPKPLPESRITTPKVIQINGGSFEMGSNEDPSEQPAHKVTVNSFLIGTNVVLVRHWRECVQAKACSYVPQGDDDQPLGNVSWNDTQQYLAWLTGVTHREWRLPSEAEWEYVARAGSRTRFWWGDAMRPGMAICKGCGEKGMMVAANPFGIYVNSGVAEWVQDCWVKNYHGAPTNGTARIVPECHERVLRGASASNDQSYARPASRDYYDATVRYPTHGFRVAASQ
jgi:class 3 adenylate cyclase